MIRKREGIFKDDVMKDNRKIILFFIFVLFVGINFFMQSQGFALGLLNYRDDSGYLVVKEASLRTKDLWITPVIITEHKSISLFPFFGYHSNGPPFKVGIRAVDYDNKNQCQKLELLELLIKKGDDRLELVTEANFIQSAFHKYLTDINHKEAMCLVPLKDWGNKDNQENIIISGKYRLYKKDGVIERSFEEKRKSYRDKYLFFIHETLE